MTDQQLFIEVPVTRRAAVKRIGVVAGSPRVWLLERDDDVPSAESDGAQVVVRPDFDTAMFRAGFGRCVGRRLYLDGIPAACDGDIVYRVEPA